MDEGKATSAAAESVSIDYEWEAQKIWDVTRQGYGSRPWREDLRAMLLPYGKAHENIAMDRLLGFHYGLRKFINRHTPWVCDAVGRGKIPMFILGSKNFDLIARTADDQIAFIMEARASWACFDKRSYGLGREYAELMGLGQDVRLTHPNARFAWVVVAEVGSVSVQMRFRNGRAAGSLFKPAHIFQLAKLFGMVDGAVYAELSARDIRCPHAGFSLAALLGDIVRWSHADAKPAPSPTPAREERLRTARASSPAAPSRG